MKLFDLIAHAIPRADPSGDPDSEWEVQRIAHHCLDMMKEAEKISWSDYKSYRDGFDIASTVFSDELIMALNSIRVLDKTRWSNTSRHWRVRRSDERQANRQQT